MTAVADFQKQLFKDGRTAGSDWVKADFHMHCPGSSDYEYKEPDAVAQLGKELNESRFSFAVVLKHQEFPTRSELAALQSHCPSTTLIPGAEINVFVDAMFKKVSKDHYFHCVLAVDPATDGDYGYLLKRAREKYIYKIGDYPAGFRSSVLDLGRFFRENGAIFLPAHLHQAKDPHQSKSIDDIYDDDAFLGFVEEGAFMALEVRQTSTATFFRGGRKTVTGRPIPRAVCVQSSDAHSHAHLVERSRYTWVQVEDLTFTELRAALAFPHRVSLIDPPRPAQRILGLHVSGTFLANIWLPLNPGMNCLIGCKGSGKTSVLECMRFLFGSPVPQDRRETVAKHLSHILGSSGVVECLVQRADKSLVVLSRRADAPQRLTVTDARGVTKDVGSAEEYFELALLGWHEIETVADSATAKIQLVDRIKGGPQVRKLYAAIERNIELARDHLPLLQQRLKRLDEALRDLWELQRKRDTLTRLEKAELLDLQNRYEWFLRAEEKLVGYQRRLEANRGQLEGILPLELAVETEDGEDGQPPGPLKLILTQIASSLADLKSFDQTTLSSLQGTRDTLVASLKEAQSEVANAFAIFRGAQYNPKVESLPPDDRDVLTRQIQILEETRSLPQKEEESRNLHAEVVRLAATVEQVCDEVCKARDEICTIREDAIAELNAALDTVRLTFGRSGDRTRLTTYKQRYAHDSGQFLGFIQGFGQRESYENLRALFRSVKDTSLDSDAWKVNNLLWDVKFVELLDVVDNDDVEIALNVGKAGFVPIQNLSSGQRCTAVFPLLLRNSRGPLVIDQPEDNLDNRHIADTIAPDLLSRKQAQQFIVTSHNANLVVLTDADLIIHMDSDGSCGWIEKAGFLACPESRIRDRVLEVLDGGKAALEARRQKYGSPSAT